MGQKTRYTPLPDQAYDPRVTDLSKPFNVPAATGPLAIDPATGQPAAGNWRNRNVTQTIPVQLLAGVSLRTLVNNQKRTGLMIQNRDPASTLNFSFGNDLQGNGAALAPGQTALFDFTTPSDALYLFCGASNLAAIVMEFSRAG